MDHQAKCAFIVAQAACMNAELAAMQARNYTSPLVGRKPFHEPGEFGWVIATKAAAQGYFYHSDEHGRRAPLHNDNVVCWMPQDGS